MPPQQCVVCREVERFARRVRHQQVSHEEQMMREPIVRVAIELQEQLRVDARAGVDDTRKVARQVGAGKGARHILGQRLKGGGLTPAQEPPGQSMVPGAIRELLHGAPIRVFHLRREIVLLEELCRSRIQTGVVRVAIDFTPVDLKRIAEPSLRHQARDIPIEHARVFL